MNLRLLASCMVLGLLCSCATQPEKEVVPTTSRVISLEKAVAEVQKTLSTARAKSADEKAGLVPSKVTVTFVMSAKDTKSNETGGNIEVALPVGLTIGGSGKSTLGAEDNASNTITLEFSSLLLAPADTVFGGVANKAGWKTVEEVDNATKGVQVFKFD